MRIDAKATCALLATSSLALSCAHQVNVADIKWNEQKVQAGKEKSFKLVVPSDFTLQRITSFGRAEYVNSSGDELTTSADTDDQKDFYDVTARMLQRSTKVGTYNISESCYRDKNPVTGEIASKCTAVIIPSSGKGLYFRIYLKSDKPLDDIVPEFDYMCSWIATHKGS
jgi:hypothetical protein